VLKSLLLKRLIRGQGFLGGKSCCVILEGKDLAGFLVLFIMETFLRAFCVYIMP